MSPAAKTTKAFVDSIDESVVSLVTEDQAFRVPAALVPEGIAEGSWLELSIRATTPPAESKGEVIRRGLVRDDGKDFKL